jgi:hypothetical protein
MKTWTPDASQHFETWLGRVRSSVARDPSLNADDIAQDLRAHVHAELETAAEPVTVGALEQVLTSLGTPPQWGGTVTEARPRVKFYEGSAANKMTEWQELLAGEWGVPVLLFVLTIIAIPTFDSIGLPLLAVAYLVARSKAVYAPKDLDGVKKWIVYLPLAVGSGVLAGFVLAFPIIIGNANRFEMVWILGLWWVIVGLLAAREPKHVQAALQPFASGFDASHGRMLSLIGAAFVIAGTVMLTSY